MTHAASDGSGRVLTTAEAAMALGVHERTVRRYIAAGLLACHRLPGGHYRIPEQAIFELWRNADRAARPRVRSAVGVSEHLSGVASSRRPLAGESRDRPYDLSIAALAALRSRLS